jgi:transcriptional regulator with XRE-family HTH domain
MNKHRADQLDTLIGRNLRVLRTLRGFDQQDIADRMAALNHPSWRHCQTVSDTERGRRAVRVSEALDLAAVLEVTLPKLLSEDLLA